MPQVRRAHHQRDRLQQGVRTGESLVSLMPQLVPGGFFIGGTVHSQYNIHICHQNLKYLAKISYICFVFTAVYPGVIYFWKHTNHLNRN
jgi:hypothetical protein